MGDSKKHKRKKGNEGPAGGGWEIVYSGFVLILLCFFIMLSSFSTMEEAKIMRFVKSFVDAVGIMQGGLKFDSGATVLPKSADIVDSNDKLAQLFSELAELNERLKKEKDITLAYSTKGLVMRLSDRALFDVGVANISPQAVPLLQKVGDIIARTNFEVRIEGHSDNLPIKTVQFPSNWELSTARAVNVLRFFLETGRISSQRMSAVGFGEFQPMVPNDSIEHRAQNRRVEIIFLHSDQKPNPVEEAL
ncbi:MAG: flagellar motor protein MotB [Deltaproteobacteria bacterium]|jgi:chemotaxis protein MotB|nr:flagellar motor protein MotB [Deltaproteobacteria bacterium]